MGAEISAYDYKRNRNVYILCYLCSNPDRMEGLFKIIGEARKKVLLEMI